MKISRHIVPEHWMCSSEVETLFTTLQGGIPKEEPQCLFVGGCVRDTVLGRESDDFDLATLLLPDDVIEILNKEGITVIPTGIKHGTVTVIIGTYKFEVTTLRHDRETDGRHAVVDYTDDWAEDAKRRDFTINTLLMDRHGNIYDPLGTGLADLDARRVVFVGDAAQRIEEDYLRILRFFRFSAFYADDWDEHGLESCEKHAHGIKNLSKERITQEFFKIIMGKKPDNVLRMMFRHDILSEYDFNAGDFAFFNAFCRFQEQYRLSSLSSRLFVFANMRFDHIKKMERYILFPKVFVKDMKAIDGILNLPDLSCDRAVREAVYRFGRVATAQSLMVNLAQDRVMNRYAPRALDIIQNWDIPIFPINGDDMIAQGIAKGPELGKKLREMEDEWIKDGFPDIRLQ